jgi:hypothetical protein
MITTAQMDVARAMVVENPPVTALSPAAVVSDAS